ncbi:hypothetical protein DFH06DRAFT_171023 [Mycena polygramma]|nr:hypothetical protein DFH06DRAFT_171023 [Mycena polygramma]
MHCDWCASSSAFLFSPPSSPSLACSRADIARPFPAPNFSTLRRLKSGVMVCCAPRDCATVDVVRALRLVELVYLLESRLCPGRELIVLRTLIRLWFPKLHRPIGARDPCDVSKRHMKRPWGTDGRHAVVSVPPHRVSLTCLAASRYTASDVDGQETAVSHTAP